MKTIDRYLLARYFYIFVVFFTAAMGLFIIADGFTNLDDFQHRAGEGGARVLLASMGQHYLYQSSRIFSLAGPTLAVMSAMCVLALTLRHGEIHPLLAAGVPLYRVALPLIIGVLAINALLTVNEELIIPRIAPYLQTKHGDSGDTAQDFEPTYDETNLIVIHGDELIPASSTIRNARFLIPETLQARKDFINAAEAVYLHENKDHPAGWLLKNAHPRFADLKLLSAGNQVLLPQADAADLFIRTGVTFDHLYNRGTGFRYLSTHDLVWRIRHPSAGLAVRRSHVLHFHERLTRPILTLIGVFLAIPLVARREKLSLITNVAVCMAALGLTYASAQGMLLFGRTGLIAPAACAWIPLIFAGSLSAWLSPLART